MSNFLTRIKRKVQKKGWERCQTKKCGKGKCKLKIHPSDRVLILDMDCKDLNYPKQNRKKCDFVVFGAAGQLVAMEMKSGPPKAKEVKQQIEAGAAFVVKNLSLGEEPQIQFQAWLVHCGIRSLEFEKMKNCQISVSGFAGCSLRMINSDSLLSEELNKIPAA